MRPPHDTLTCRSCGAASPLPVDLEALAFDCQYCGSHQLLPEHLVEHRRQQLDRQRRPSPPSAPPSSSSPSSSAASLGVIVGACISFVIFLIVLFILLIEPETQPPVRVVSVPSVTTTDVPAPSVEPPPPLPPPPIVLPEETDANNGLAEVRARMNALHEAGCDRVLIPPTRRDSGTGMTAQMDPSTHCVVVLAATSMPDTTVHLLATDAHGNPIDTPAAASAFEWRHCPKLAGDHRLVIEHDGPGPYHAGAYDCPRRKFSKLEPIAAPFVSQP